MKVNRPARHRQVVLLLRTLTDYDYQPPTWTGSVVRQNAKRGELATAWIDCPACGGSGERRVRTVMQRCDECRGRGVVKVDPYTGRKGGTLESDLHDRVRWVICDGCGGPRPGRAPGMHGNGQQCERCADSGRPGYVRAPSKPIRPWRGMARPTADAPELGPGDPVIACMERRQLAGSYEELGLALGVLRLEQLHVYRLVVQVFVEAATEEDDLDTRGETLLREGLQQIDGMMPEEIRVPGWAARWEQRRRERIVEGRPKSEEAA